MSVGVEVDALALMLDGCMTMEDIRFNGYNIETLERRQSLSGREPAMSLVVTRPGWADVAEAILDLEAWADWRPLEVSHPKDDQPPMNALAYAAQDEAESRNPHLEWFDEVYLEAAALLRDGWRPEGWRP